MSKEPRVITWDLEIANSPDVLIGGWDAARRGDAGLACLCLYDTYTERYHVYDHHTKDQCISHMQQANILVGYNTLNFDVPAFEGYANIQLEPLHYDLYYEMGVEKPAILTEYRLIRAGYKLGDVAARTLSEAKPFSGSHAPDLFNDGKWGELVDYCIHDVHLTRKLVNFVEEHGYIIDPAGGKFDLSDKKLGLKC